jgi:RNA-directed DNA polymerase
LPSWPAGAAKNRRWAKTRYFGRYNKARNDTWVSGDPKGQRRKALPLAPSAERAIRAQHGRCPLCGEPLLYADQPPDSPGQWETWFRVIRTAITRQVITVQTADDRTGDQPRLMHTACYAATQTAQPGRHAESRACPPHAGCFSPVPRRVARRVVRGRWPQQCAPLPRHRDLQRNKATHGGTSRKRPA